MAEPLRIRFATDTSAVKSGMQDLAATIVSSMVKVSGAVASHSEAAGAAFGRLGQAFGTGAQGVANAATTIAGDVRAIGAAGIKAANDSRMSSVAIGAAMGQAAAQTTTAAVASQAAMGALAAQASATFAIVRREVAATLAVLTASPAFVGIAAAIALYVALDKAANFARDSVEEMLKVADGAERAGVGSTFFQRWIGEAKELRVELRELEGMLQRARDAATIRIGEDGGAGRSAIGDRLQQHVNAGNLGAADKARFDAATSQEQKIRIILDLIEQLRAKGAELAALDLAGKMFGADFEAKMRSGVDMVGRMKAAVDSIDATAGGKRIFSPEEEETARQIEAQGQRIAKLLAEAIAPILKDIVAVGQEEYRGWLAIAEAIAEAAKAVSGLYVQVSQLLAKVDEFAGRDPLGNLATRLGADRIRQYLGIKAPANTEVFGPPAPDNGPLQVSVSPKRDKSKGLQPLRGGGASDPGETVDQIERLIQQMEKSKEVAQAELDSLGKSNAEREKALALAKATAAAREAGRDLTEEERAKVEALAEATARVKDQTKDAQQAIRETAEAMRSLGEMGVEALSDMILEGKSFSDTMRSVEKQLAKILLQAALMGSGPLAGLLGLSAPASAGSNASGGLLGLGAAAINWIGAGFAEGGYTGAGGTNEPAGIVHRGEYVLPASFVRRAGIGAIENFMRMPGFAVGGLAGLPALAGAAGAASGAITIAIGGSMIDARGADAGVEARLQAALDQRDRAWREALPSLIRDAVGRGRI